MAAPAPEMVVEPKIKIVPKNDWVNILLIDDDTGFLDRNKELFEFNKMTKVDIVNSPENAIKKLKSSKRGYDAVVVDINYDNSLMSGYDLIANNRKLFGNAEIIVITGTVTGNEDKRFESLGIEVIDKGEDDWRRKVSNIIENSKQINIDLIKKRLGGIADVESESDEKTSVLDSGVKDLLIEWLVNFSNPEESVFLMGGDSMNAYELAEQVENETEDGQRLFSMFIDEMRYCLKL